MNIVCVEPLGIPEDTFQALKAEFAAQGHDFRYYMDRHEDPQTLVSRMHDAHIVAISNIPLPAAVLTRCPSLRYLSVAFTGLDHIDLDYCRQHNIQVQNAAGYSSVAVSELAVGLMLDLLRRVTPLDAATRRLEGRANVLGRELHGKTVGVVGTGAIGTAVIRLLLAFGCNILAYNRSRHPEVETLGARYSDLDTLLRQSDIVTLHLPLTAETRHLISRQRLALLKPTALLVNTARGNVVDIPALADALAEGRLAGAAVDVYEQEPPLPATHPLLAAPNCICLPHVGFATREAFDIRAGIVFDHIRQHLKL